MSSDKQPRVLFVFPIRVNGNDNFSSSLLFRNLFCGWKRENLAQIYSSGANGDGGFCGHYFEIGAPERGFGRLFQKLKSRAGNELFAAGRDPASQQANPPNGALAVRRWPWRVVKALGKTALDTGLYEILFPIKMSRRLGRFIADFHPDIIFAEGYLISNCRLPRLISQRFHVPICFYTSDDWPSYLHGNGVAMPKVLRHAICRWVDGEARKLIEAAQLRYAFNPMMKEVYEARYQRSFGVLMNCDDPRRFDAAVPRVLAPSASACIVAAGAFGPERADTLLDLEKACGLLGQQGTSVLVKVFALCVEESVLAALSNSAHVEILPTASHNELPSCLKGADALFLAETFDPLVAHGYRFSVSTKAHMFMFSKRPILVYGHPENGVVQYAKSLAWALVLEQRDIPQLACCLKEVLFNHSLRERLVKRAMWVADNYHNAAAVQAAFRREIAGSLPHRY